ncbi:MAG TPA: UbiA family prenyltransferase [Burkholderiaceae bacterium]|nr:UbiA family prenyltransferase [Burkholderiaceae bacterium]
MGRAGRPSPRSDAEVSDEPPLFVDLDGTLIAGDSLFESLFAATKSRPLKAFAFPFWLLRSRACLKEELAKLARLDPALLPYRSDVCDFLRTERARGRKIYLATAANERIAQGVATSLGIFDGVLASDGTTNLKGVNKLRAIQALAGARFAYAGNDKHDLVIWSAADSAILVSAPQWLQARVRAGTEVERSFPRAPRRAAELLTAMRPHQWLKNLLVFVSLLTSFHFSEIAPVLASVTAFVALSLCASATYIVNDLFDLEADRKHPRKRARTFASGAASIPQGLIAALVLLVAGLAAASLVSPPLLAVVTGYVVMTTAYSLHLKSYVVLDVIVLAALYMIRIVAGAVAIQVEVSVWLLAFALFLFVSLALVKRCAELVLFESQGIRGSSGRDYQVADLRVLWPLGIAMGVCSVVVFALYINAPEVQARYGAPLLLWLVAIALVYWIGRMWIKASRGEMSDDPIVFALRNAGSRILIAAMIMATLAAYFVGFK